MIAENACPTCGTPFQGRFCHTCGEKRLGPHDLSLGHYWHELVHGFTHADGKIIKSLKAVLLRPGELSRAYMAGRRQFYMRPVSLFIVLNLIYFLVPLFEVFNTTLHSQMHFNPYSAMARQWIETTTTAAGTDFAAYQQAYAPRSSSNAKLMLVLLVFILSLPMALLYRGKSRWTSGHVTFSFEVMIFNLMTTAILMALLLFGLAVMIQWAGGDPAFIVQERVTSSFAFVLNMFLFFNAGRRFYQCSIPGAFWRALVGTMLLLLCLTIYRFLLFVVTHWQVKAALGG